MQARVHRGVDLHDHCRHGSQQLLGFCIGGIWAIAGGLAARLATASRACMPRAIPGQLWRQSPWACWPRPCCSWAGGHSVDRLGLAGNLWLAAGFAAAALLLALRSKPFTGSE
ncbi:hypothetical protein CBF45_10285 [Bordetella sp. J329]|nr:hypothetical protein CBF45_10285 [Bordetella sp. J329]